MPGRRPRDLLVAEHADLARADRLTRDDEEPNAIAADEFLEVDQLESMSLSGLKSSGLNDRENRPSSSVEQPEREARGRGQTFSMGDCRTGL